MKHFIVLFHVIVCIIGFSSITLSFVTYLKNKNSLIRYYVYFLLSMTFIVFEQSITSYSLVNSFYSVYVERILKLVSFISCAFMVYALPLFIYKLLKIEGWESRKGIFKALSFFMVFYFIPYSVFKTESAIVINSIILFSVVSYCLWIAVAHVKRIEDEKIQRKAKACIVALILFISYMFIDTKTKYIPILSMYFPYGLLSLPIFYLFWNSVSLYLIAEQLKVGEETPIKTEGTGMPLCNEGYYENEGYNKNEDHYKNQDYDNNEGFYEKYGISNREREIVDLLLKGCSYKEIGEKLCISMSTVKTHVRNIYQKTEVSSKIQLLHLANRQDTRA